MGVKFKYKDTIITFKIFIWTYIIPMWNFLISFIILLFWDLFFLCISAPKASITLPNSLAIPLSTWAFCATEHLSRYIDRLRASRYTDRWRAVDTLILGMYLRNASLPHKRGNLSKCIAQIALQFNDGLNLISLFPGTVWQSITHKWH